MARWVLRALALLAWLSPAAFTIWVSVQTHTSTSQTCVNATCTTQRITTSDWMANLLEVIGIVLVLLVVGLLPAGIIYRQSVSGSGGSLVALWIAVPILALATFGFAFTWMGSAAFYWGVFVLPAAVVGSIAWMSRRLASHGSVVT